MSATSSTARVSWRKCGNRPSDFFKRTFGREIKFSYFCRAFEHRIELWCNGNTADFGSVVPGSSPGSSTQKTGCLIQTPRLLYLLLSSFFGALRRQSAATVGGGLHPMFRPPLGGVFFAGERSDMSGCFDFGLRPPLNMTAELSPRVKRSGIEGSRRPPLGICKRYLLSGSFLYGL